MATRTGSPEFFRPSILWGPSTCMSPPALPTAPDSWIEDLLTIVNFNLERGLIFLCMVCKGEGGRLKGLYNGQHFEEGRDGYGHKRLQLYDVDSYVCVKKSDMQSLGVKVENVQSIVDKQDLSCSTSIYLHSGCEFFLESSSSKSICMKRMCLNCCVPLVNKEKNIMYCCLECSYYAVDGIPNMTINSGRLSLPLSSALAKHEQDIGNASFPSYGKVVKAITAKRVLFPPRSATDKRVNGNSKPLYTHGELDFVSFDGNESNVAPDNPDFLIAQGSREQASECLYDNDEYPREAKSLDSDDDKDPEENSTPESDTSSRASMEEDIVQLSKRLSAVAARSSAQNILRDSKRPHILDRCVLKMTAALLHGVAKEIEYQCYQGENEITDLMGVYDNPAADRDQEIFSAGADAATGDMTRNFPSPAGTVETESSGSCNDITRTISFRRV